MAWATHPSIDEILRVPGYLFWNPTNLAAEATWGTKLGYSEKGITFSPSLHILPLTEEETGDEITDLVYVGGTPAVTAIIQSHNTIMLARLFPGMGGTNKANSPGSYSAGKVISSMSGVYAPLLFVPDDRANNPCLLLQKATPHESGASLNFSHKNRVMYSIVFVPLRKTNDADGIWYLGALSGATLR